MFFNNDFLGYLLNNFHENVSAADITDTYQQLAKNKCNFIPEKRKLDACDVILKRFSHENEKTGAN